MNTKCGFIAIVGRPNVGKSTLTNFLVGSKVSITTRKPQTTRNNILGVKTISENQYVFVDTPGIHSDTVRELNKRMNKSAVSATSDVDAIAFVVEAGKWLPDDELVLKKLKGKKCPIILLINKVDKIKNKESMLEYMDDINSKHDFHSIIPLSALNGEQVDKFVSILSTIIPESPHYFPQEQITDKDRSFQIQEIIREKLFLCIGEEVPYSLTAIVEKIEDTDKLIKVNAVILVERDGQKKIVIGKSGEVLKKVGTQSRLELEKMFGKKIFLRLWVKVKDKWADNEKLLKQYGFIEK